MRPDMNDLSSMLDDLTNDKRRFGVSPSIMDPAGVRAPRRSRFADGAGDHRSQDQMVRRLRPTPPASPTGVLDPAAHRLRRCRRRSVSAALEAQGYLGDPEKGLTELLDGWSVEQAKASGAFAPSCCCRTAPIARWPRPRSRSVVPWSPSATGSVSPWCSSRCSINSTIRRSARLVLETAQRFAAMSPDLLKLRSRSTVRS